MKRREFIKALGLTAGAVGLGGCRSWGETAGGRDGNLTALLSDIHIGDPAISTKWGMQPDYPHGYLERTIDSILALPERPARAVVFGDVALWFGRAGDYSFSRKILKRLEDAGIEVFVTTGNHDHRETLLAAYPEQRRLTPVPGRVCSKIDLGGADLLLFDSLDENPAGEGSANAVAGLLEPAQAEWLLAEAAKAKRPFMLGAHHPPAELLIDGACFLARFQGMPYFAGYIYGHTHRWTPGWFHKDYGDRRITRHLCLPSTGWWGTIGYSLLRTYPDRVEVSLAPDNDFFFPRPLRPGEARPAQWDEIAAEEAGAKCVFRCSAFDVG